MAFHAVWIAIASPVTEKGVFGRDQKVRRALFTGNQLLNKERT